MSKTSALGLPSVLKCKRTSIQRLAEWSVSLESSGLDPLVLDAAVDAIVDTTGVSLFGARMPLARKLRDAAIAETRPGNATLFSGGACLHPTGAALANGTAAHQLDFDDTHLDTLVHASCIILPATLACAEEADVGSLDLLAGFIVGSEISYILGRMLPDLFWRGWWPSSVLASIGAAAGAARIMRMNEEMTANALALATSYTFGLRTILGTDANPLGAGAAAQSGVRAALLAGRGIVGPSDAIEHPNGLAAAFNGGVLDSSQLDRLGLEFGLVKPGVSVKRFPACSGTQAGAQAMTELIAEDGVDPDKVERVLCSVTPVVYENLRFSQPANLTQAQFSMPFAIGCILASRQFSVDQLTDDWLHSDVMQQVMKRVEMQRADGLVPPGWRQQFPEAVKLTCWLSDGRTVQRTVFAAKGMPNVPLTDDEKKAKFMECAAGSLSSAAANQLLMALLNLRSDSPVRALLAPLRLGEYVHDRSP